jgi:hypothetical protein
MLTDDNIIERVSISVATTVDQVLEERDSKIFSQNWMQIYSLINLELPRLDKGQSELTTCIREEAYLRSFARWKSADLAACVSDDFGLIADSAALNIGHPGIDYILQCYKKGAIPTTIEITG